MPREIPDVPNGWKPPQPDTGHSYEIELLTPMVGGGATASKVDSDFPIRPTAIRGHLRHWWRLVRGHSLGNVMWRREEEIFGSTEFPSPVTVIVSPGPKNPTLFPIAHISPTSTHGYILFPSIDKGQDILQEGYQFNLRLSIPTPDQLRKRRRAQNRGRKPSEQLPDDIAAIDDDVCMAVNAWLLFGGLGARTRRGCGTLRLIKESLPNLKDLLQWMPQDFRVYQPDRKLSHLEAWERTIELLKKFRQQMPARRGESRRKFPEAETLRRISGRRGRRNRAVLESELPSGFPRAELGLPIVFQFKDGSGPDGMTALPHGLDSESKQLQRMASPVILKPIPVSATESIPTLIVLRRPTGLTVDVEGASSQPVTGAQFAQYPNSPLAGTSGSAIEAFINFSGFTEVTR
jgi:CRISPR-associated protein Cmr1